MGIFSDQSPDCGAAPNILAPFTATVAHSTIVNHQIVASPDSVSLWLAAEAVLALLPLQSRPLTKGCGKPVLDDKGHRFLPLPAAPENMA